MIGLAFHMMVLEDQDGADYDWLEGELQVLIDKGLIEVRDGKYYAVEGKE